MQQLISTRHAKYLCNFVWIPKHRRTILTGNISEYTKEVLRETAKDLDCKILTLEVIPDNAHHLISCPPRHPPSYLANYSKGKSARLTLKRFPNLGKGKLWTRNYLLSTALNIPSETIKRYIEERWANEAEED